MFGLNFNLAISILSTSASQMRFCYLDVSTLAAFFKSAFVA